MILYQYFISDTRVQREASFLTNKGFKIEIINLKKPNLKSSQPYLKTVQAIKIDFPLDPQKNC